jgi:hypothetical protein
VRYVARYADDVVTVLSPEVAGPPGRWYRQLPVISDFELAGYVAARRPHDQAPADS